MTNAEFVETNVEFLEACKQTITTNEHKDLKPSRRQASKWRRRKGIAWKIGRPELS